ncbi:MAG: hypothetical protein WCH01_03915 [Methylococcaceae bacterium]
MHDECYSYPIKTLDFKAFNRKAQLRMFREEGEPKSYFFTVAFPGIKDEENDGFILESEVTSVGDQYDIFVFENIPELVINNNVKVSFASDTRQKTISIRISGTPVNGTASFWTHSFQL